MLRACGPLDDGSLRQDSHVPSHMPIIGRDKLDRAVLMVLILPHDEGLHLGARDLEIAKRLRGKGGVMLQCARQRC